MIYPTLRIFSNLPWKRIRLPDLREDSTKVRTTMVGDGGSAILGDTSNNDPIRLQPQFGDIFNMVTRKSFRWGLSFCLLCILTGAVRADVPTDPAARAKLIGSPKALQVQPEKLQLSGPRATAQLVVTGVYADGTVRDLTHLADFRLEGADALVGID